RAAARARRLAHNPLRVQLSRGAKYIPPMNVEGRGKTGDRDFGRYLGYALGCGCELEYHIILARDAGEISEGDFNSLMRQVVDIKRMLHGLIDRLAEQ